VVLGGEEGTLEVKVVFGFEMVEVGLAGIGVDFFIFGLSPSARDFRNSALSRTVFFVASENGFFLFSALMACGFFAACFLAEFSGFFTPVGALFPSERGFAGADGCAFLLTVAFTVSGVFFSSVEPVSEVFARISTALLIGSIVEGANVFFTIALATGFLINDSEEGFFGLAAAILRLAKEVR
jgi:hypothetical protein